jgi:hypothetical protein
MMMLVGETAEEWQQRVMSAAVPVSPTTRSGRSGLGHWQNGILCLILLMWARFCWAQNDFSFPPPFYLALDSTTTHHTRSMTRRQFLNATFSASSPTSPMTNTVVSASESGGLTSTNATSSSLVGGTPNQTTTCDDANCVGQSAPQEVQPGRGCVGRIHPCRPTRWSDDGDTLQHIFFM